jgi:hypothetical protein
MAYTIPLHDYIAIGTLVFDDAHGNTLMERDWVEVYVVTQHQSSNNDKALLQKTAAAIERLVKARWVRLIAKHENKTTFYRIYLLPDNVGRGSVSRHRKGLRSDVELLLSNINTSIDTWNARTISDSSFQSWATAEDGSLFYIFNTLPSPNPNPDSIKDRYTRLALHELLDTDILIPGLKSNLYPYQARSAAAMIQQESTTEARLDPRYETREGPDGAEYYFIPRELAFSKSKPMYESNRGGILAETMGYGCVFS